MVGGIEKTPAKVERVGDRLIQDDGRKSSRPLGEICALRVSPFRGRSSRFPDCQELPTLGMEVAKRISISQDRLARKTCGNGLEPVEEQSHGRGFPRLFS